MFVRTLHSRQGTHHNPEWRDIEAAISALDGDDIHMAGPAPASMTVGGSEEGLFAQITLDGDYFHYLLGPNRSDDLVPIVVGRQKIEMEQRKISDLESVLRAAKVFAEAGEIDEALDWEAG
jgi:hypothetical protein